MKYNRYILILTLSVAGFFLPGCKNWEYNVVKNGIHFDKIHQSKGGTNTGYMTENQTIQGFPCKKGWIHFKKDWRLLSFQLSKDFMYNNILLPASTWIHFPYHGSRTGYTCSFPRDFKIQGYLCSGSGGYKGTHTSFYDSGRLRSFFAPEDVVVKGIPCETSLFVNVRLYENGDIQSCKLAEDIKIDGIVYKNGKTIVFDAKGKIK